MWESKHLNILKTSFNNIQDEPNGFFYKMHCDLIVRFWYAFLLYLLFLIFQVKISDHYKEYADQGFLNTIYMPRKEGQFSLSLVDNFNMGTIYNRGYRHNWLRLKDKIINYHMAGGCNKPWQDHCGNHTELEGIHKMWKQIEKDVNRTFGIK